MPFANRSNVLQAHVQSPSPAPFPRAADARRAKKRRANARVEEAVRRCPDLRTDRLTPIRDVLRGYRGRSDEDQTRGPLAAYVRGVEEELALLEDYVATLPRSAHREGATIRRALCFLKSFGRISALDFDLVPIEERPILVELLRLEYRWCFAAAGTTPRAFKIAIGRTGAR
jgi:hypothetical protein